MFGAFNYFLVIFDTDLITLTHFDWVSDSMEILYSGVHTFSPCIGYSVHAFSFVSGMTWYKYMDCLSLHYSQKGQVLQALFRCTKCRRSTRVWSSFRVFGGHYLVNQKLVYSMCWFAVLVLQTAHFTRYACIYCPLICKQNSTCFHCCWCAAVPIQTYDRVLLQRWVQLGRTTSTKVGGSVYRNHK